MKQLFSGFPHIIGAEQFDRSFLEKELFIEAQNMKGIAANGGSTILKNKLVIILFYEPSTRTRFSFGAATIKLGGQYLESENAKEFSSAVKGETLEDTIRTHCQYGPHVIIMRHFEDGAAARAAAVSSVPIINAGDGKGQHPTQALLDIFTIMEELGRVDGIHIAMVGDLVNGRTVRSLSYLLGKFKGVKITFVSPECARMKDDIKEYLRKHKVEFDETIDLRSVAGKVDVIYQTRTQKERGSNFDNKPFTVDTDIMDLMPTGSIVMHPLPRNEEIAIAVDNDRRAAYFRQAQNGLFVRMALLRMILAPKQ